MPAIRNTNEQIEGAAQSARSATDEAARTARIIVDETARAGEQAARAEAEIARQGAETAREAMQSGLNTALESFRRVTDQFNQVIGFTGPDSEALTRRSSQNIDAVSQAGTVLARGAQEISQEWLSRAQDRFTKNLEALNRLAQCRSVQDFLAVQSDLVRDNLQQSIDAGRRVAELSLRVVNQAAGPIKAQADRNAVEVERNADRTRRVA